MLRLSRIARLSRMAHPLDGVRAKLARADSHLDALKEAVQEVIPSDPDFIPGEFDPKSGHYVFRARHDSRHPMWLGPIVGDFVHNVMAALDYLIVELVTVAKNPVTGANGFPIFENDLRYRIESRRKLRGVPPTAAAAVERLQPFYGPNSQPWHPDWQDPTEQPLWHLYSLDKRDKHQALNLTEDVIAGTLVGLDAIGIHSPPEPGIVAGRFERGAVVATLDLGGKREVDVYLSATYDVAFDRGGPAAGESVIEVLDNIRKTVRQRVIPRFRPYFPPE